MLGHGVTALLSGYPLLCWMSVARFEDSVYLAFTAGYVVAGIGKEIESKLDHVIESLEKGQVVRLYALRRVLRRESTLTICFAPRWYSRVPVAPCDPARSPWSPSRHTCRGRIAERDRVVDRDAGVVGVECRDQAAVGCRVIRRRLRPRVGHDILCGGSARWCLCPPATRTAFPWHCQVNEPGPG